MQQVVSLRLLAVAVVLPPVRMKMHRLRLWLVFVDRRVYSGLADFLTDFLERTALWFVPAPLAVLRQEISQRLGHIGQVGGKFSKLVGHTEESANVSHAGWGLVVDDS
jgi:hypothetical protein